jgi:limonene-1,2-epoxide hydrolase
MRAILLTVALSNEPRSYPMAKTNSEIVTDFITAWNQRDLEAIMSYIAPDCFYHNIPMPALTGEAAIRENLTGFVAMASEIDWIVYHIAESAAGVVLTERLDRFNIGGRWIEMPLMGIFELEGGKIKSWKDYFDLGQFNAQMAPPA